MVIFTQFVASSFVMAFVCFQLSRVCYFNRNCKNDQVRTYFFFQMKVGLNFLTAANDLMVVSFQVFFYCYHGTLLIEEVANKLKSKGCIKYLFVEQEFVWCHLYESLVRIWHSVQKSSYSFDGAFEETYGCYSRKTSAGVSWNIYNGRVTNNFYCVSHFGMWF